MLSNRLEIYKILIFFIMSYQSRCLNFYKLTTLFSTRYKYIDMAGWVLSSIIFHFFKSSFSGSHLNLPVLVNDIRNFSFEFSSSGSLFFYSWFIRCFMIVFHTIIVFESFVFLDFYVIIVASHSGSWAVTMMMMALIQMKVFSLMARLGCMGL